MKIQIDKILTDLISMIIFIKHNCGQFRVLIMFKYDYETFLAERLAFARLSESATAQYRSLTEALCNI